MYILELNQWEEHEYNNTITIAVSEDINKLKAIAGENTKIFDEQWVEKSDSILILEFDTEHYEDSCRMYRCQTYSIQSIKCV